MTGTTTDEARFIAEFEAGTVSPQSFHHADHVRLAWSYLREGTLPAALTRFPEALRRFARAIGQERIYHETVTWVYLLVIHERLERTGRDRGWDEFATANPDLFAREPSLLEQSYRPETLASDLARRVFVWPDRLAG